MKSPWAMVTVLLCGSMACSEGASEVSLVTYARVAAVRVEPAGDPTRATPRLDEAAGARVLVIGPDGASEVTYAMGLCVAAASNGGLPSCAGPLLVTGEGRDTMPTIDWPSLPRDLIDDGSELLLLGTICEQGTPAPDTTRPGACVDPDFTGVSFFSRIPWLGAAPDAIENHHPRLDAARLTVNDVPWEAGECGVTLARDGQEQTLSVVLGDAGRETHDGEPEELLLSWFTTAGQLSEHFSVLESFDPVERALSVTWTAPKADAPDMPERARVTLVLRDPRGGVTWTEREICLE